MARIPEHPELHPQIKYYIVKRVKVPEKTFGVASMLKVTCPHCMEWDLKKLRWIKGQYRTRPCGYCFRTSFVPHKLPKR